MAEIERALTYTEVLWSDVRYLHVMQAAKELAPNPATSYRFTRRSWDGGAPERTATTARQPPPPPALTASLTKLSPRRPTSTWDSQTVTERLPMVRTARIPHDGVPPSKPGTWSFRVTLRRDPAASPANILPKINRMAPRANTEANAPFMGGTLMNTNRFAYKVTDSALLNKLKVRPTR